MSRSTDGAASYNFGLTWEAAPSADFEPITFVYLKIVLFTPHLIFSKIYCNINYEF
ncbi:MAG: hypothetical protein WCS37_00180 [Chloroflexota bacterium]|nr:hypothetical protein [Chloroflexota bacterium]